MCPVQVRVNLWYTDGDRSLCNKPIVRSARDSRSSEGKNGKYNVLREEITVHRCRVMFTIISSRHCMPLP